MSDARELLLIALFTSIVCVGFGVLVAVLVP